MTAETGRPMWRSMLFVPVIVEKFVDAAHRRGADAIILDLEDSVPESQKPRARELIQDAAAKVSRGGADVTVRINRPWRQTLRDLEAAVSPGVRALLCPKIASADHVKMIAEVVSDLEAERGMTVGSTCLVPMIETADAFFHIHEIARADPRIVAINLGAEDFALSVGMLPEAEGLFYPKQHLIIAARAAGVMPLGFIGTVADFKDLDAFRATIRRSRRLGFMGASVIHPSQIQILNEEFRPTAEEVDLARRIVAAYDKSTAEGVGAIVLDGKMIDVPIVVRAQQTLARETAIAAMERKAAVAT
ncbi:MAG TPA: CoA ester lyase [Candidatus Sulfotelmatobacter sp.]|nr:CoA ester lyase [Candidatus Sulfotelmatobacter sp.]